MRETSFLYDELLAESKREKLCFFNQRRGESKGVLCTSVEKKIDLKTEKWLNACVFIFYIDHVIYHM